MENNQIVKFKRDLLSLLFIGTFIKYFAKKYYASCFTEVSKIEQLDSHISGIISNLLFHILKKKYTVADCNLAEPFRQACSTRFNNESGVSFLRADILCIKPWISDKEKGVLMIKYTEIMNALPFIFDLKKIQAKYHLVLEPSTESPYQMYNAFIQNDSCVFVQSLSVREQKIHVGHGFFTVPVCAGDWVNANNFHPIESAIKKYDFCVIANFIPFKRYPFLFSALGKYWAGELKFAVLASNYGGENKNVIDRLVAENNLAGKMELHMEVPPAGVNKILNESYCHVLASKREGANKANFESMIAGTPVVVYKYHIGFPNWRFSPPLVMNYTNAKNLISAIKECRKIKRTDVAGEARKLIGSKRATEILNEAIKKATTAKGDEWTRDLMEKVNNVHTFYHNPDDVNYCIDDYNYLESIVINKSHYNASLAIQRFGKK